MQQWQVVVPAVLRALLSLYFLCSLSFRLAFRQHALYSDGVSERGSEGVAWLWLLADTAADVFFWTSAAAGLVGRLFGRHRVQDEDQASEGVSEWGSGGGGVSGRGRRRSSVFEMVPRRGSVLSGRVSERRSSSRVSPAPSIPPSPAGRLLRSLSSFSDYDIFSTTPSKGGSGSGTSKGRSKGKGGSGSGSGTGTDESVASEQLSTFEKNHEDQEMLITIKKSQSAEQSHYLHDFLEFIMLCPFEVIGYVLGYEHYYLLRAFRLVRVIRIPTYFNDVTQILVDTEVMVGASARRVVYLTIFMVIFAHIGACCFYALALHLLENGVKDVWLTADDIVSFDDDSGDGSYHFNAPVGYRYVRVLYWAVVTSQTVGFGDVSPVSIQETSFCLAFFYLSHFLCAQLAIGNLLLLFDVYDSARTQYKERIEQLEKYAQFRKLPAELKDRITYFYYHQWKVLQGLDETQLLEELPNNVKIKVKQATVRNYLLKVPFLKGLKMVVMNTLADNVKLIIFSPSDVIVPIASMSTGMYIISRGEAFLSSSDFRSNDDAGGVSYREHQKIVSAEYDDQENGGDGENNEDDTAQKVLEKIRENEKMSSPKDKGGTFTQSLKEGDYFGVQALTKKYEHTLSLNAGTSVCEVLFLSRVRFQRTISLLLSKADAKPYMSQTQLNSTSSGGGGHDRHRRINGFQKTMSHVRQTTALNLETTSASEFSLRLKVDGDLRTAWDVIIFIGITFYSITIPFDLSHTFKHSLFSSYVALFSIGYLIDVIFVVDLFCRMFVFPAYSKSVLMTSSRNIFSVYQSEFPLYLELLSVIPFDFIAMIDSNERNLLPVLRLFKIYHLSKFQVYGSMAEKAMTKYFDFSLSFSTSRFIRLQIALFELCHWAACLWQLVADFSTHELNYDTNWKIQDRDSDFSNIKYTTTMDNFTAYIRSLYWAINALSTSGVADMTSTNMAEMIFVCFALLLGCQLINAVLGSIASMMGNINKNKSDFSNKINAVIKYMKFKRLPVRLQLKVRFFYEYNFQRTQGVDEMKLLAGLPQPLREDVVSFVVGSVVVGIPFFNHCSEPMIEMILGLLTRRCFLNNDDVVLAGEFGTEFFIIESGSILVTSKDKTTVYANLKHGNYIGESCLLKVAERTASAHARDYSETYVLRKIDFENVVEVFPDDGEIVISKINDLLNTRQLQNREMEVKRSRRSLISTFQRLESIRSLDTSDLSLWNTFLEEHSYINKLWKFFLLFILLYNCFMIPLRLAFTKDSFGLYYAIDYFLDLVLLIDMYLNAYKFRRIVGGKKIKFSNNIWNNYKDSEFKYDLLARFPYDILALAFVTDHTPLSPWFILAFLRLPKMFLVIRLPVFLDAAEYIIEKAKISFFGLRMLQVLVSCLMVGHSLGCGLYVFQKAHYGESCVNEEGALYGDACKYRDTWIQFLIYTSKLPSDGGSAFARYVACINWAIPTMVLYTVGDVYPMNVNETVYIFVAMFIGIPINAMIVGTIIALVTQVDDQSADILMKSDSLRENLIENNASDELIEKVSDYIKFLVSEEGQLLSKEDEIFEELPHTLQVLVSTHLKEKFFRDCPFFDFVPSEAIRKMCMTMKQHIYYTGDYITTHGDIGHEMFFIESGTCEVISWDKRTVLAKLQTGAFIGETSFFGLSDHSNKSMILENIRATSICVCYVLKKRHYDHELLPFADGPDAENRRMNLQFLRDGHCKRNAATLKNMKQMENAQSKLSSILGPISVKVKLNPWIVFISPLGWFRFIVDVIGYVAMIYYAIVIPFEVTFLHGDISNYWAILRIDFAVDVLCAVELLLRLSVFPLAKDDSKSYEMKSTELYTTMFDKIIDLCAIVPVELFVLVPAIPLEGIFFLRCIHLLRLSKLFVRTKQMEERMLHIGITIHFTTLAVVRGILVYILGNHWMSCMCFFIHRYFERGVSNTWVVSDGYATFDYSTNQHDICSEKIIVCYQRSIYFVGTVLTSVGYGDVAPFTTGEMIFQIFLAIVGACMGANICGQLSSYLKLGDRTGEMAFKEKLKSVEHYCSYRNFNPDLRLSLIANYHIMWNKERRVGSKKSSFMHALPTGMMGEVALALNKEIFEVVPLFHSCRKSLHSRVAYQLKPQITLPNTSVYTVGDNGSNFFLILAGQVKVTTTRKDSKLDDITLACLTILEDKHAYLKNMHENGHHFGEFALSSALGIRRDKAVAMEITETYALNKDDLWDAVFRRMPTPEQYLFLKSMLSTVGGYMYIKDKKKITTDMKHIANRRFRTLGELVTVVIEDIAGLRNRSDVMEYIDENSQDEEVVEGKEDELDYGKDDDDEDDDDDDDALIRKPAPTVEFLQEVESFGD